MQLYHTYDLIQSWWYIPIVPALDRQRQVDQEFKATFGYIVASGSTWTTGGLEKKAKEMTQ